MTMLLRTPFVIALPALVGALAGCNAVTGADGLALGGSSGAGGAAATDTGTGATTTAGGGGQATTTSSAGGAGQGGGGACSPACGANAHCVAAACACDDGYVEQGGACVAADPGDPAQRTEKQVCDAWKKGHVEAEPSPLVASGQECDPGALKAGAIADTLARLNLFRWLSGLGPTGHDATFDANAQKCANLEAFWDWGSGLSPHQPPGDAKCWTAEGAQTAGESNIAWGSNSPAQAIDQFVEDSGDNNVDGRGHRRWIMNPPLGPVGIGYWETGGQYGNAECLRVFASQGNGPHPSWYAVPNQGYVPLTVATWTWTFHGSIQGIAGADVKMLDVDANAPLAVTVQHLKQGYAEDAVSWWPNGWAPQAGKTYRVTVSGLAGGDVSYEVKPVACD